MRITSSSLRSSLLRPPQNRIAVALSGGRDSLLALALLKDAGHDVLGVHGRFLDDAPGRMPHDALARDLAERCAALGADFAVLDLRDDFERLVVAPFVQAYLDGKTPNPCCLCNARLKFGLLLDKAAALGAEKIATGHYARLTHDANARAALWRGRDTGKDQSYFLSLVPSENLARAVFPLAERHKEGVLGELSARGLPPPLPGESQDVCFVPGDDYKSFLRGQAAGLPGSGPIVLEDGTVVGRHQGLWRHTQGQRRGLGVAHTEPLYVLAKDVARNALVVGPAARAHCRTVLAANLNVLVPPAEWPETLAAKTRSRQEPAAAKARIEGERLVVTFATPHPLPAPGQIAALYDQEGRVLAGGIIDAFAP